MKNNIQIGLSIILLICLNILSVTAQPANRKAFKDFIKSEESTGWISFTDDNPIIANTIFTSYKSEFDLSYDDEMRILKTETDELGYTHFRYQQYYKGLKVMYAEYLVHQSAEGKLKSINGKLLTGLNLSNIPVIDEKQALDNALKFINAKKYLWQNDIAETQLKNERRDVNATYYPKGELVFAPDNNELRLTVSNYKLSWCFEVYTEDANAVAKRIFVDAATGKILSDAAISMSCFSGSGATTFNGTRNVSTFLFPGVGYGSINSCHTTDITVYNCNGGGVSNNLYMDNDNTWTDQSATQCMYGSDQTYLYFFNEHGRESWDNAAGPMVSYNNSNIPGLGLNNACWGCTGNSSAFGAGSTGNANDDWNTLDIVGHEFSHGVTQASANLTYSHESGALNESFSDIFGEMIESFSTGNCDWLVADDIGVIRNFFSPNNLNCPDTYGGAHWHSSTNPADNYGVHTNSSVQNYMFYLLSEGDIGTNDLGHAFSVAGIGRFEARQIAYRALTVYLNSSSDFLDARAAWIQSAKDLYGNCSNQAIQTGLAWRAVGVYTLAAPFQVVACGNYPVNGTFVQGVTSVQGGGQCTTTIDPNPNTVYFAANDQIFLFNGFTALNGSNFVAYIEPCAVTLYRNASQLMSEAERTSEEKKSISSDNINSEISLFPNPANDFITVKLASDSKTTLKVYSSTMQLIKTFNFENGIENKISTADLSPGIYFIDAQSAGQSHKAKFIVNH